MKSTDLTELPEKLVTAIFNEIPIISQSIAVNQKERSFFRDSSKIFEAESGEGIIYRGEFDNWVYFLITGQLRVYPEFFERKKNLVSYIAPGEMFGELAFIRDLNRNATIVADENAKRIIFLGTDFSAFGDINDFSVVSISTKIFFRRSAVLIIRKRLEMLKIDFPDNELVQKSPIFKPYVGEKNTLRELLYLKDQSEVFAKHLNKWNRSLESNINYGTVTSQVGVERIKSLLDK